MKEATDDIEWSRRWFVPLMYMKVEDISNRMMIMKARAMGKTSVHRAYEACDQDWWWESYLKKFIVRLLDSEPIMIGVDVAGTGGDYSVIGLLDRAKSKVRTSRSSFKRKKMVREF